MESTRRPGESPTAAHARVCLACSLRYETNEFAGGERRELLRARCQQGCEPCRGAEFQRRGRSPEAQGSWKDRPRTLFARSPARCQNAVDLEDDAGLRLLTFGPVLGPIRLDSFVLTELLERPFLTMGARVKWIDVRPRNNRRRAVSGISLDVRHDRRGEYFLITQDPQTTVDLVVLDVQPRDRHLLLLSRDGQEKHRFLLGHDERHWFVAGIPETAPVSRVRDAKQALKPDLVQSSERGLRAKYRDRRSNAARIRQGEWFFVPAPDAQVEKFLVLRNEPIAR